MPNWVSTTLLVSGPADSIARFKEKAASFREENSSSQVISFEAFLPMPKDLKISSSSNSELGYSVFHGTDLDCAKVLAYPWIQALRPSKHNPREALKLFLDISRPDAREGGAQYARNLANHGFTTWYPWSTANWGTKWDACDAYLVDEDEKWVNYSFNTAWSPAEPVIQAMSEQFPELEFVATFDEESGEFYYQATWVQGDKTTEEALEREPSEDFEDEDED